MHRIVHLDLKGAPWRVHYLEKVILLSKQWGATGVLFEWEDTFPYIGDIVDIGSIGGSGGDEMYSVTEVQHLMGFVKGCGMEVIQLIQTIGHMEFVLKHPAFRPLRESPQSCAVLCPSHRDALDLVKMMLQQALDLQPDAKYLHIGADEVWHSGVCPDCKQRAETSKYQKASLFLDHIRALAIFIKQQRPNLTVLMWDDMLRSVSVDILKEYKLGELVEPVLWHYNAKDCFQIDPNLWEVYRQVFPRVWGGSAFKGANGSCCIATPVSRYASNHEAWVEEIKKYNAYLAFGGVILTGWSRYDHYATLCELLPISLPSLASCLKILNKLNNYSNDNVVSDTLPSNEWPGEELAQDICSFAVLRDRCMRFIHGDFTYHVHFSHNSPQLDILPPIDNVVSDTLPSNEWPGEELAQDICSFAVLRDRCMRFIHGDL
ncbi:glycosyl hydrolase family 20, catalytic domain-containing protein [Phthorimaea operculella]|nr:glycosyl hydrolase family 20, catalytic domain-containing protein [Phthorimaea operculella]